MHLVPGTSQTLTPEWFGNVRSPTTVWILDILLWRLVFPLHCVDVEQAHIFTLGASTTSDSSTLRGIPRDRQVRIRNTPAAHNVMIYDYKYHGEICRIARQSVVRFDQICLIAVLMITR